MGTMNGSWPTSPETGSFGGCSPPSIGADVSAWHFSKTLLWTMFDACAYELAERLWNSLSVSAPNSEIPPNGKASSRPGAVSTRRINKISDF